MTTEKTDLKLLQVHSAKISLRQAKRLLNRNYKRALKGKLQL